MESGRVGGGRSQERPKTFPRGRSLKVYRASRWSAIGLIGYPAQKTVLDEAGFLMEGFTNPTDGLLPFRQLTSAAVRRSALRVRRQVGLQEASEHEFQV